MKHFFMYPHGGSGNHGCEAIVRTSVQMIGGNRNDISLLSYDTFADKDYNIDEICNLYDMYSKKRVKRKSREFVIAYLKAKLLQNNDFLSDLPLINAINARKGDVALSIGGDNYCYGDAFIAELIDLDDFWRRNNIKTVLWGVSIEPDLLKKPNVANDISRFDLVTARESISFEAIRSINNNTVLVCDSAFVLEKEEPNLPKRFANKQFVGINISPLIEEKERKKGITRKNVQCLIDYILNETEYNIMLIPHVIIENSDDRKVNEFFYDMYKSTNRILLVDDCNCKQLKGYISKCSVFVGARTHATIAAYSSSVPTLVLGYSVKSKGIARDLFGDEDKYVIPVQRLSKENELLNKFLWILSNKERIKERLDNYLPEYTSRINNGLDALNKI